MTKEEKKDEGNYLTTFRQAIKNLGLENTYIPASGIPVAILKEEIRIMESKRRQNG